jgi:AcrR family transcriptional regulator
METPKELTTRERRRERTKVVILQAAEDLLIEGGLQNMTLANIAHRAAYSKPAIYEYFKGIEDILNELANAGFIRLGEMVKAVPETLPPEERAIAACRAVLQFAYENVELYQLMFTHIIFTNNMQDWNLQDTRKETQAAYQAVSEIIQDGIDQGVFKTRPGFDRGAMHYMCWVMVHGMASLKRKLLEEVGLDVQQYQAEMFHIMINNLKGVR